MPKKEEIKFEDFLLSLNPENLGFVNEMHELMLKNDCSYKIELAKNGYVFSYLAPKTKKVILNYVFRKKGMIVRLYGDNINKYEDMLNALPDNMIKAIEKAPACKRLIDPTKCNSRCPMGYVFEIKGNTYKNCRYNCFMFDVKEENYDAIQTFVQNELNARTA